MPITINGTGPVDGITSINTSVSSTELGYLDGVTSGIQSQINTSGGLVKIVDNTFSASSAVNINNCFSSLYQNYLITMHMTTAGTGAASVFRLRASGTDATGSNYNQQRSSVGSTTYTGGRLASQSTWFGHGYVATLNYLLITLFRPNEIEPTAGIAQMGRGTDTVIDMDNFTLGHTLSTAYDGFTMGFGSNSTGTLRVYGYRN